MKIHRLEILNLNSLYGSFTIDFDQHFKNTPLFLIHGPTGAGKSTLLDAICLALYGQTPRLTSTNKSSDQTSTQHIMSHGTVECRAAVMFSYRSACGTTREYYRAEWFSERAHKKSRLDGTIKNAHRSLFRVDANGHPIGDLITSSDKPKDYQEHFDRVLAGMDIQAFQRSVMLAQGQFSEFLKANDQQKNAILERLTDTSNYRDIGARAAARKKEMDDALSQHKSKMADIKVLSAEELEELNTSLLSASTQAGVHEAELKSIRQQILWLENFEKLHAEKEITAEQLAEKQQTYSVHAPDFARLERDALCQPAATARARVAETSSQLLQLERLLPDLREKVEIAEKTTSQAETVQKNASNALLSAREALAKSQPDLQQARELFKALHISAKELADAENHHKQVITEHAQAEAAHKLACENVESTAQKLLTAREHQNSLQFAAAITQHLADWQNRASQLTLSRNNLVEKQNQARQTNQEVQNLSQELQAQQQKLAGEQAHIAPLATALENAQEALNLMLHLNRCADISELRDQFHNLRHKASARKTALERAFESHNRLLKDEKLYHSLLKKRDEQLKSQEMLDAEQKSSQQNMAHAEEIVETLKQSLHGFAIALSFGQTRRELKNGDQCPVCGSVEHPFKHNSEHAEPEGELQRLHDKTQQKLSDAEQSLRTAQAAFHHGLTRIAVAEQNLAALDERLAELTQARKATEAQTLTLLQTAGFENNEIHAWSPTDFTTHIDAATHAMEQADKNTHALQQKIDAQTKAQEQHRSAIEQTQKLEESITILTHRIEDRTARFDALQAELSTLTGNVAAAEAALLESLGTCNIHVTKHGDAYDFSAALAQAEKLKRDFDAAALAVSTATLQAQTAENALTAAQVTLDACTKNLEASQSRLNERHEQKTSLDAQFQHSLKALDGQAPDVFEIRLSDAIQSAEKQLENAQSTSSRACEELAKARAELASRTQLYKETTDALARETSLYHQKLAEFDLSEDSLLQILLTPEEREQLKVRTTEIAEALSQAQAVHAATSQRFEQHQSNKPATLSEFSTPEEFVEQSTKLSEKSQILESERDTITEQMGRIKEKLEESTRASEKHLALQQELEKLERETSMWHEIYKLIGVGSGESFQRFAQSLNVGELVRAANRWLHKLFPRYELGILIGKDGEPTLTFTILDRENAGKERPINTLSGGETFVVSLALALALADFSQVRLPLETILLDEGFGTLDSETLDSVLNVLNTLQQQSGRQIGIISHVEGLKERIDHRIHIEKQNRTQSAITIIAGGVPTSALTSKSAPAIATTP